MKFLDLEPECREYKNSRFVVIPVPYEATTTYGRGTKNGPAAILRASQHLEEFDEETGCETYVKTPVHTSKPVSVSSLVPRLSSIVMDKKIPVILGGEHSITGHILPEFAKYYKDLSVLQLDAHADLRDSYKGNKHSHASVMRRVLEVCPAVQVGIRSISKEGWDFARRSGQIKKIHWVDRPLAADRIAAQLSKNVYISFDVDAFDPSIMPATGTPEPGGLLWNEALHILRTVCRSKNIVGFDVMELSPQKGLTAPDFMCAKLVYKMMGMVAAGRS